MHLRYGFTGLAASLLSLALASTSGLDAARRQETTARTQPVAAADASLPADVFPETRNRVPRIRMEDLDAEGKRVVAAAKGGLEAILASAPRSIRIYSPRVAEYMTQGNDYLRYQSGLDPQLREVTILVAARAMDAQYEWAAHEEDAIAAGVPQGVIETIKHGRPAASVKDPKQAAVIDLGREALYDHHVRPGTFKRAVDLLGRKQLIDVVSLMGHYTATAILLHAFDQQLPPGKKPLLPVPDPIRSR
jgi:4-carboxymuconolactone decarboxylase